ncbi:MAG: hypothetical protein M1823_006008 [Watsoniomyces obsoletus]|nr:MAG: hypothetical protein M1823_006008 [Watsoniomyces obsoletus]
MSLPPQTIRIKRKKGDEPVDSLYVQTEPKVKKRRFTDFFFRRVVDPEDTSSLQLPAISNHGIQRSISVGKMATPAPELPPPDKMEICEPALVVLDKQVVPDTKEEEKEEKEEKEEEYTYDTYIYQPRLRKIDDDLIQGRIGLLIVDDEVRAEWGEYEEIDPGEEDGYEDEEEDENAEGFHGNDYPEDPSSDEDDDGDGEDSGDDDGEDEDGYPRPSRRRERRRHVLGDDDDDGEDGVTRERYYVDGDDNDEEGFGRWE